MSCFLGSTSPNTTSTFSINSLFSLITIKRVGNQFHDLSYATVLRTLFRNIATIACLHVTFIQPQLLRWKLLTKSNYNPTLVLVWLYLNSALVLKLFRMCLGDVVTFVMFVCWSECSNWLPLDVFSWNLIFEYFSKIYREHLNFIKVWEEKRVLYIKTCTHL